MSRRSEALTAIEQERDYQDVKCGDGQPFAYDLLLLQHFAFKASGLLMSKGEQAALDAVREVAAIALRAMETHGIVTREGTTFATYAEAMEKFASRGDRVSDHEGE